MKLFYACSPRTDELTAIAATKPDNVLLSYAMWKNKDIGIDFVERVGYRPKNIMLDSGAYTFFNKNIESGVDTLRWLFTCNEQTARQAGFDMLRDLFTADLYCIDGGGLPLYPFHRYFLFIHENLSYIDCLVSMDTIGKPDISLYSFKMLKTMLRGMGNIYRCEDNDFKLKLLPVIGYGQPERDIELLARAGYDYIALGGLVPVKSKWEKIRWINSVVNRHTGVRFHLLGCQDRFVLERTPLAYSADGTTWNTNASFTRDRGGRSKVEVAIQLIKNYESWLERRDVRNGSDAVNLADVYQFPERTI